MISVKEETLTAYAAGAHVPIAFRVESIFRIDPAAHGLGGLSMTEEAIPEPYVKDYDIYDNGTEEWAKHWDLSNWGFLSAYEDNQRVGSAAIAWKTEGVDKLENKNDLAVLWDLRVDPESRRKGIGRQLFADTVHWARQRHCKRLKIETQNINVASCRFYSAVGCELVTINVRGYDECPGEAELIWEKELDASAGNHISDPS